MIIGFKVQGYGLWVMVAASPRIYMGQCPKVVFKSQVTSHLSSYEKTGKNLRLCADNVSTLSTASAVPLPHAGKAYTERRFASIL